MSPFLTASGRWVFLTGVLFSIVGAALGEPLLIFFGQIPLLVLLIGLVSLILPARVVERRVASLIVDGGEVPVGTLRSGDSLILPIWCENPSKVGLFIKELRPYVAGELEAGEVKQRLHVEPGQARRFDLSLRVPRIGRFSLQGFDILLQDRFGLLGVRDYLPCRYVVESYPPLTRAQVRRVRRLRAGSEEVASRGSVRPQMSGELRELREYQPGDALRTVAWKATVRQQRLITQEFEEERPHVELVALDISSSMRAGTPGGEKFEHALRLVSELSGAYLEDGRSLGLWTFDEGGFGRIQIGQGEAHGRRIQRHLVLAKALIGSERVGVDEATLEEILADYLHVQDRLDFRRRSGRSAEIDRELLNRWLRAVNGQLEKELKGNLRFSGERPGSVSEVRRFFELRGIPLPPPSELRPGEKGRALNQVLRDILVGGVRSGRLTIVSDLCGMSDVEAFERALRLLRERGLEVRVLAPFTPLYGEGRSAGEHEALLRDLFARAELRERRALAERLRQSAVEVQFVGPDYRVRS